MLKENVKMNAKQKWNIKKAKRKEKEKGKRKEKDNGEKKRK